MDGIGMSGKVTAFGIALLVSAISASDQISIVGEWNCIRSSIKHDAYIVSVEEHFEFSSEGWYVSDANLQSKHMNVESVNLSLHVNGLWTVEDGVLLREMAQVLVSSWVPSNNSVQDDEVAALLKKEYETGHRSRNEIHWLDGKRMALLDETGAIAFACENLERQ
jgi:hypothetical protein